MARRMQVGRTRELVKPRWRVFVGRRPPGEGDLRRYLPDDAGFSLDIGSAPSATGEGGASLDILVLGDGSARGGAVAVRLIGVLHADHTRLGRTVRNDRPVAVACEAKVFAGVGEIGDLGEAELAMLTRAWTTYNAARCASFQVVSMTGAADAMRLVRRQPDQSSTSRSDGAPPGRGEAPATVSPGGPGGL